MQLAQQFPDLHVVGLGAQDSLEDANDFVAQTGTGTGNITMVWDPSYDSWRQFGVRSQPYWILLSADGTIVASRPGAIDFDAVRAVLSA